jgi:stearoyl-CoA desaturase (delta-9 desaturase)
MDMSTVPQSPRRSSRSSHTAGTAARVAVNSLRSPLTVEEVQEIRGAGREPGELDEEGSFGHKALVTVVVVLPLLALVSAIVFAWQFGWMSPLYLGLMFGGWLLTGLGITVGYHRMLTHRSFDTHNSVRLFWAGLGALAVEGPPLAWCAVHRRHHQHSDQAGDPHSPHLHGEGIVNSLKGFLHSHFAWMYRRTWNQDDLHRYVPDLMAVPGMQAIGRWYVWFVVASLLTPAVIGGLATWSWAGAGLGLLWGGLARVCLTHHVTWSINSICHIFGRRDFHAGDDSRNNVIFGILSHGEGWHNNHHAFPTSARHGLKWWQLDTSWLVIRAMGLLGLVWNIRTPSRKAMEAKRVA